MIAGSMTEGQSVTPDSLVGRFYEHLYQEATLLDEGRLDEWFGSVHPLIDYRVLGRTLLWADGIGSWHEGATLVQDNYAALQMRISRMAMRTAWAQNPRSLTRRIVGNVRVAWPPLAGQAAHGSTEGIEGRMTARSTVVLVRYFGEDQELLSCERTDTFHYDHERDAILLLSRKVVVDGEPVGLRNLSMIL